MLDQIQNELHRVGANAVRVSLDDQFDPKAGTLVRVELQGAYWHLFPNRFLELLKDLPDQEGDERVRHAIETQEAFVWHGPAPKGSRDTSY